MLDANKLRALHGVVWRLVGLSWNELRTITLNSTSYDPDILEYCITINIYLLSSLQTINACIVVTLPESTWKLYCSICNAYFIGKDSNKVLLPIASHSVFLANIILHLSSLRTKPRPTCPPRKTVTLLLSFVRPSHDIFIDTISTLLFTLSCTCSSLSAYSLQRDHARAVVPRFSNGLFSK